MSSSDEALGSTTPPADHPRRQVLVIGAALGECVVRVPNLPERGGHVWTEPVLTGVGGSAFNVLRGLVRLGHTPGAGLTVGSGTWADVVARELDRLGTPSLLPSHDADNGWCLVMVTPEGERTFVTTPGCETDWDPTRLAAIEVSDEAIVSVSGFQLAAPGHHLLAWLETLPSSVSVVADLGARVTDLVRDRRLLARVLERCELVAVNEEEAAVLLGGSSVAGGSDAARRRAYPDDVEAWARVRGHAVILRCGADGAWWLPADGARAIHAPAREVEVVDTAGAGDAHLAGILAGLAEGCSRQDALTLANEAASQVVAGAGAEGLLT